MTLAKVKEQDGMMLVKVKEQDGMIKPVARILRGRFFFCGAERRRKFLAN